MSVRSKRSLGGLGLGMIAVLFIALVILSDALLRSARLDLTEHRLYTVSAGTRSILDSLDEPVTLYFFFSRRATEGVPYLRSYGQRVREMLEEFSKHAGPRLRLQVIDPLPFSEAEDQAVSFGLEAVSLGGVGDAVYLGLAGTNAVDGVEVIPFFQPEREALLEYDLARLVWALGNPQRPVVGLVTPLQMMRGFDPQAGGVRDAWVAISQLEQLVELRNLGARPGHIEADIDLLLVVHPKELDDATLYAIDQFVMGGGQLLAFVDPQADMEALDPLLGHAGAAFQERASDLNRLFEPWGFRAETSTVLLDFGTALMVNIGGGPPVRHLAMLGIGPEGMAADDVVTAPLDRINVATAGHIAPLGTADIRFTPLLESSAESMLISASRVAILPDPAVLMDEFVPSGERRAIAARIEGALPTAFPDGPPQGVDPPMEHRSRSDGEVSMLVVADTDLLSDRLWVQVRSLLGQQLVQAFADNGAFLTNALDHLSGSRELINVRSRGSFSRPFDRVEDLRREAELRLRSQEQRLQVELEETESKLLELELARQDGDMLLLTPEQEAELARFQAEQLRIRRALREVRRNLDADIERLGNQLKLINIVLVPGLVACAAVGAVGWRNRRRRRAAEGR
jgi:ABC-type uncharacterized transport system involved in gliding motility auxiliary subunit